MTHRRHKDNVNSAPTMHRWTAKHYAITALIVILAVGAFAYSWS